jgi:hypothetical protein
MEIPDVVQFKYGDVYPSEAVMYWMRLQTLNIWPELTPYVNKIHVLYAGASSEFAFWRRSKFAVADEIRTEYNNGKRNFMFQCLSEGVMIDNILLIDDTMDVVSDILPNISIFYISGDHVADQSYKTICKRYSRQERIHILAGAGFERGSKSFLDFAKEYVPGPRSKKFLCFNKVTRQHRINILQKLLKLDLVNDSYYSFSIEPANLQVLKNDDRGTYDDILRIEDKLPLVLNMTSERHNPVDVRIDDMMYFETSYFSVVTETLFFDLAKRKPDNLYMHVVDTFPGVFFSEKIYKCIALNHPFVLVSTYGSLRELRKRGYKTFAPYINESYDDIIDDDERLDAIVHEINRLCNLSEQELVQFTYDIKEIVEHNSAHFKQTTDFRITENVAGLLK